MTGFLTWANSTLLKMTNLQQIAKMTIPSQNMYFNSLKKKLQQVNLIKNPRSLPLPRKRKKKNWTSELECLQCHEIESGNNQGRNSCIYCILCTAVLHSPDLASGVNWKDSICWVTKQWWPQNVFRQVHGRAQHRPFFLFISTNSYRPRNLCLLCKSLVICSWYSTCDAQTRNV